KPGPGTINEAISMKLPVLLDTSSTPLFWEKVNSELVKQYRIGEVISKKRKLPRLLEKYLLAGRRHREAPVAIAIDVARSGRLALRPLGGSRING
ncbi:MAG: hypothetical protein ACLPWF_09035, partial [Bryobacteraceae bacterium]